VPIRASLTIVALAAAIWILDKGKEFFVPVIAAGLLAFTLMPLVRLGNRFHIPAAVVATVILFGAGLGGGVIVSSNAEDAAKLVARMPELTQFIVVKVRRLLLVSRDEPARLAQNDTSAWRKPAVPDTAPARIEMLSPEAAGNPGTTLGAIADPVSVRDFAAKAASELASGAGKAFVIALLTFFLLLSADNLKGKLFSLSGSRLSQKKRALRALEESARQIQLYLLITITANLVVALLAWLLLWAIGLESAASWAIGLGIAHTVPYLGAIAGTLLISMAAVFQFESWQVGLEVLLGLGAICAVVGTLIMTLMQGKAARIDPAILFTGLLLFTWLWGGWGLLLGAPILAVAKTVMSYAGADRINEVLEA
jgi:predicted PurR-regulated permease PerM